MKSKSNTKYVSLIDMAKAKLIEIGVDYFKKNIETSKKEIFKYIEKNIERKIKNEIKKQSFKIISLILFGLGIIFLIYSFFQILVLLLNLELFFVNILFGLTSVLIGIILYLLYN